MRQAIMALGALGASLAFITGCGGQAATAVKAPDNVTHSNAPHAVTDTGANPPTSTPELPARELGSAVATWAVDPNKAPPAKAKTASPVAIVSRTNLATSSLPVGPITLEPSTVATEPSVQRLPATQGKQNKPSKSHADAMFNPPDVPLPIASLDPTALVKQPVPVTTQEKPKLRVIGFVQVGQPQVLVEFEGEVKALAAGDYVDQIQVVELGKQSVTFQLYSEKWQTRLFAQDWLHEANTASIGGNPYSLERTTPVSGGGSYASNYGPPPPAIGNLTTVAGPAPALPPVTNTPGLSGMGAVPLPGMNGSNQELNSTLPVMPTLNMAPPGLPGTGIPGVGLPGTPGGIAGPPN
ncbi:MAG: hypothetical protein SFX18_02930 [Pirellulales bacterium]|nr:hypothetical protein [Pirellulales bacterium]